MDIRSKNTRRTLTAALLAATLVTGAALATVVYPGKIIVKKWYDRNGDGIWQSSEPSLSNWPMTLTPPGTTQLTVSGVTTFANLTPGWYSVLEGTPSQANWHQSAPKVNGVVVNPVSVYVHSYQTKTIKFGNYCTKGSGGRTPGYWGNKNGEATMNDGATGAAFELGLLSGLNLVDANGNAFDPTTYGQFNAWLQASDAVNMAYKLSSHLAAMRLNVEAGFVNGGSFYAPYGGTINSLIAAANAALGADGYTPSGDEPNRSTQEALKNFLDSLNNGAQIIPYTPCARTFPYTPPPY
jgi:hypothetical protein